MNICHCSLWNGHGFLEPQNTGRPLLSFAICIFKKRLICFILKNYEYPHIKSEFYLRVRINKPLARCVPIYKFQESNTIDMTLVILSALWMMHIWIFLFTNNVHTIMCWCIDSYTPDYKKCNKKQTANINKYIFLTYASLLGWNSTYWRNYMYITNNLRSAQWLHCFQYYSDFDA